MSEIVIPKLNNNDVDYVITEWLVDDGAYVEAETPVAIIETSKASHDLLAPESGVLSRLLPASSDCVAGDVAARLFATAAERDMALASSRPEPARDAEGSAAPDRATPTAEADDLLLTDAARELAERMAVPTERLRALGRRLIRAHDVERLVGAAGASPGLPPEAGPRPGPAGNGAHAAVPGPGEADPSTRAGSTIALSRNQRAVAQVVATSRATIPTAYLVLKVQADAAYDLRRRNLAAGGRPIGPPALLIKAVADAFPRFPAFFGTLLPDGRRLAVPASPHVGVTIDVGAGLFVPVIHDAAARSLEEVAEALADFRSKARTGSFKDADLTDGAITVTLHDYTDVVTAVPIVFPGQVAALALGGTATEPLVKADGQVVGRRSFHLGLAYDHRVVNGRDAVLFLKDVKASIESPDRLQAPAERPADTTERRS
nr:E2 duhyrolipoyl acyltransferase [Actinoallomurus sp.]